MPITTPTLDFPLDSCVPVSLSAPPNPSPFPRTTVRVPILSLLTEEYFRGRSARPRPAGPGLPVGRLNVSGPRPCPPPPPPYSMAIISGSRSPLEGMYHCWEDRG